MSSSLLSSQNSVSVDGEVEVDRFARIQITRSENAAFERADEVRDREEQLSLFPDEVCGDDAGLVDVKKLPACRPALPDACEECVALNPEARLECDAADSSDHVVHW